MRMDLRSSAMVALGVAIGVWIAARPASAHHSYAMFDRTKVVTVTGTIAKLDWRNPHIFVWVYVKNPSTGTQELYAAEGGSRNNLERHGWSSHTFELGETVTLTINPLRDGRTGGYFVKAVKTDGTVVQGDNAAGPGDGKLPGFPEGESTK